MNGVPLDELYFDWLYRQVADPEQDLTFWNVLRVLYKTPFAWHVPNDENRVADAKALRERFIDTQGIRLHREDRDWADMGCSMLEVIVALAERLEFEADKGRAHYWFWVLMDNIGLSGYDDSHFDEEVKEHVQEVLEMVIQRYYEPNGHGGFFPLERPYQDQREVELWYQLSAYVLERELAG
jgi:hypothetical protein